jgi:hypothetical protein
LRKIRKKHNKNVKRGGEKQMKKKGRILAILALILGAAYLIYSITYWGGANSGGTDAEQVGAGIATVLVMPHLAITGFAVLFNALGAFMYNRAFVLVAGILYAVAILLFPVYFMFVVVQAVLCFIAFAIMQKKQPNN